MPPVIGAAIAGIAVGLGAAGAVTITATGVAVATFTALQAALIGFTVFAIGTASSLLQQNRASFEQRIGGLLTSRRASVTPGRLLYGNVRVGGPITAMFASDYIRPGHSRKLNSYLHMLITLAYSPINEVLTVFLDDYPIHLQSMVNGTGGVIVGRYFDEDEQDHPEWINDAAVISTDDLPNGPHGINPGFTTQGRFNVQIQVDTGDISNVGDLKDFQPFPDLSSRVPEWTIDHKQLSRGKIYVRLLFNPKMFPGGVPNITAYVRGKNAKDTRDSVIDYTPNPAYILRNVLLVARKFGGLALDDTAGSSVIEIDEDSFTAAANNSDEEVLVSQEFLESRKFRVFSGTNFTYLDESGTISPPTFTYFPAILDNTIIGSIKRGVDINTGDKVTVIGEDTILPDGLTSGDFYIILKGIGQGLSNTELLDIGHAKLTLKETRQLYQVGFATTYLNAIRDIPIESSVPNRGNDATDIFLIQKIAEPRYQCSAIIELDRTPQDYISDILSSMGARLIYAGGKFSLVSYDFFTPTISYDESDLRKPFQVQTKVSRRDRFNIVKGLYTSSRNLGRPSNYPSAQRALWLTNDNEEKLLRDFNFPFTSSQTAAQRLAKIELEKHRQEIRVSLPLRLSGLLSQTGDNIQLSLSDMGWTNKVFEILEWTFIIDQDSEGNPIVGVDLRVKETASAIWDWDETQDEREDDFADDTDLPDGSVIEPPSNLEVAESLFTTSSGSFVQVRLTLSWNASPGPFFQKYEVEFKRSTDTDHQTMAPTESTSQEINDVETGITYNLRVRAINTLGIPSIWLEKDHEVFGLSALPADVQNCSLIPVGIVALVTIDPTVDDDVRLGGKILVRHDKDIVSGDWINSVSIFASTSSGELNDSSIVSGQKTQFFVPLKTGTYLFKFQDSAGFTSLNACSQVLEAFSLDGFQTLDTITENPSFSGTHTNTTVNDGLLRLELYSDVSPSTEVISQGTYLFNGSFDFGARKKVRITSTIGVTIVLVNDLIDDRLDNIDTWASFDGILGSDADAQMFIRYQTTDPAVPDFGPWQSIQTSGEFDIWAAEFKVELSSFSSVANIHIDTLSMIAEEPLAL